MTRSKGRLSSSSSQLKVTVTFAHVPQSGDGGAGDCHFHGWKKIRRKTSLLAYLMNDPRKVQPAKTHLFRVPGSLLAGAITRHPVRSECTVEFGYSYDTATLYRDRHDTMGSSRPGRRCGSLCSSGLAASDRKREMIGIKRRATHCESLFSISLPGFETLSCLRLFVPNHTEKTRSNREMPDTQRGIPTCLVSKNVICLICLRVRQREWVHPTRK